MNKFIKMLESRDVVLLSGGVGSELYRRGYETKVPLWSASANIDALILVKNIYEDYADAGADIITTNTFRTQPRTFVKAGFSGEDAKKATLNAVRSALEVKKTAKREIFVGGGLATLEDCYEPRNTPQDSVLLAEHSVQAELLASHGVDFLFCETINTIREAGILSQICKRIGLPFFISFITNQEGCLLSGETLKDALASIRSFKPNAVLLNCRPPEILNAGVNILIDVYDGIKGAYPNGKGKPDSRIGWEFVDNSDLNVFLKYTSGWVARGLKIIGGCCGTTPEYIKALAQTLKKAT